MASGVHFKSAGTQTYTSASSSISIPVPATYADNDLLLLIVDAWEGGISAPSGWTEIGSASTGYNSSAGSAVPKTTNQVFWKRASGSESSVSVSSSSNIFANGYRLCGQMVAFGGVITTGDPIEAQAVTAAALNGDPASLSVTGVTTTSANAGLILVSTAGGTARNATREFYGDTATLTSPITGYSGWREVVDNAAMAAAGNASTQIGVAWSDKASAGATGGLTVKFRAFANTTAYTSRVIAITPDTAATTERLAVDTIVSGSATTSNMNSDDDSNGASAGSGSSATVRLGFPTPALPLTGVQSMVISGATNGGQATYAIRETGSSTNLASVTVTDTSNQRVVLNFDASSLSDQTGASVELYLSLNETNVAGPVKVCFVEWTAVNQTLAPTRKAVRYTYWS